MNLSLRHLLAALLVVFVANALLLPSTAHAADGEDDLTLRISGDYTLESGQTVGTVIVIDGHAQIDGTVRHSLFVFNGTATVSGTTGSIFMFDSTLVLREAASVDDVFLFGSDMEQEPGARIQGEVVNEDDLNFRLGDTILIAGIAFLLLTVVVLFATGIVFAAIGGRQLTESALLITVEPARTFVAALIFWIVLPIASVLLLFTVVAIPVAMLIWLFLPFVWLLGFVVVATRLGGFVTKLQHRPSNHPYAPMLIGITALSLVLVIPVVGWLIGAIAGFWGTGAIVLLAWRAVRSPSHPDEPPSPPLQPSAPPSDTPQPPVEPSPPPAGAVDEPLPVQPNERPPS